LEKQHDQNITGFVQRRLSQLKLLSRLVEHELNAGKGGKDVTLDRQLAESILDTVEIFIEDFEKTHGGGAARPAAEAKPAVTRLN
jgi:hypothetical protein